MINPDKAAPILTAVQLNVVPTTLDVKFKSAFAVLQPVVVDKELTQNARDTMQEIGIDLSTDTDEFVYINYCAISSAEDYNDLIQAIISRSVPSEADVKAASDTFQGNV